MSFRLDFKRFKKIKSDKHSTTMRHEDGHEITIAHAALSPKMRSDLHALPTAEAPKKKEQVKMAEGGAPEDAQVAQSSPEQATAAPAPQAPVVVNVGTPQQAQAPQHDQSMAQAVGAHIGSAIREGLSGTIGAVKTLASPIANAASGFAEGLGGPQEAQAAIPPSAPTQSAPQASLAPAQGTPSDQDPYGTKVSYDAATQGLENQRQGIAGEAQATGQAAAAEQQALKQSVAIQQKAMADYKTHFSALENERQAFMRDYQNQHIDPQHFLRSMGTGQRIATAIGLILGGIGSATGQPNAGLAFLNKQIDNDIEAQKAELGKKEGLLNANMKQFGNIRDATDMTRVMQTDIAANQLKQAALTAATPAAKARALKELGALQAQNASLLGQMAMRKTLLSGMQAGQISPAKVVNMVVPEHERAEANKELVDAQNTITFRDNLIDAFDKLNKTNTVGNRAAHLGFTPAAVKAIRDPLVAALSKGTAGKFTETDAHMLESLFPAPGDSPGTIATKREQIIKLASEKMHFPKLETYGINLGQSSGSTPIPEGAPVRK